MSFGPYTATRHEQDFIDGGDLSSVLMGEYEINYENEYEICLKNFLKFEQEEDVFSVEVGGVRVWERIRQKCFKKLLLESGIEKKPHTRVDQDKYTNYLRGGYKWLKSLVVKNPFFESESDFLFIGSSRRKVRDDGYQWDLFCDPIIDNLDIDYVYTEPPYLFSHRTPAKTEDIRYLDFITYTSVIQREVGLAQYDFSTDEIEVLSEIEDEFSSTFDIDMNIKEMVENELSERKSRKWLYERLLDRIQPKIAIIVAGTFKRTFIETCKEKGIPVVELQHGGFGSDHLGYSFTDGRACTTFPDYLFVFGELWRDSVEFPIPTTNVYPVGYPYLEEEVQKYETVEDSDKIIFISQGPKGDIISKFTTAFAERDHEYDIIYKLHPGEYHRWRKQYPWLESAPLQVIDDDSVPLYKLFAESRVQVGVNSTALYEGLIFDLDTYILECQGTVSVQYLIEQDIATTVSSVDEFHKALNQDNCGNEFNADYIFKPDAINNISEAFNDVLKREYGE